MIWNKLGRRRTTLGSMLPTHETQTGGVPIAVNKQQTEVSVHLPAPSTPQIPEQHTLRALTLLGGKLL